MIRKKLFVAFCLMFAAVAPGGVTAADLPYPLPENKLTRGDKKFIDAASAIEVRIEKEGLVLRDPDFEKYLDNILSALVPETYSEYGVNFHSRILLDGGLSVVTFPNGGIYISAGLIPRIDNEDQLAFLLSREVGHVVYRHIVIADRNRRAKGIAQVSAGIVMTTMADDLFGEDSIQSIAMKKMGTYLADGGQIVVFNASMKGYGKEQEEKADVFGLRMMTKAGYDPKQAIEILKKVSRIVEDIQSNDDIEPAFLVNPKRNEERLIAIKTYIGTMGLRSSTAETAPPDTSKKYCTQSRAMRAKAGLVCNSEKRFATAEWIFNKLIKEYPTDAKYHYYRGETYRQWAEEYKRPELYEKAKAEYLKCFEITPKNAEAHLGMGLVYKQLGMKDDAIREIELYLASGVGGFAATKAKIILSELKNE